MTDTITRLDEPDTTMVLEAVSAPQEPEHPVGVVKLKDPNAGRAQRRKAPIMAYVGPNGGGKSLAMVHDTLPSLKSGRKVLSTVELINPYTGEPYPNYERLTSWGQLLEARHCDVLFDEVVGIASARESQGLPVQVSNLLVQLRRRDIVLRWSAPAWTRADRIIRETSQAVTVCTGMLTERIPAGETRLWGQKRLFRWRTYDCVDFDEWTTAKQGKLDALTKAWFWRPGREAPLSYRTLDDVSTVGYTTDSGRCAVCGGNRPRQRCTCDDMKGAAGSGFVEVEDATPHRHLPRARRVGQDE